MRVGQGGLRPAFAVILGIALPLLGCESEVAFTAAPVAVIAGDSALPVGARGVLDGTDSHVPGLPGASLTYAWALVSGAPGGLELSAPSEASTPFDVAAAGLYVVRLTVTHEGRVSEPAFVNVRGFAANLPPLAEAGDDRQVDPGAEVILDGSASSDPNGDSLTFSWRQLTGANVALTGADTASPRFIAPLPVQSLAFELVVTDPKGLSSAADQVMVSVSDVPPVAIIDADQATAVEDRVFSFDGLDSFDANGELVTGYQWDVRSSLAIQILNSTLPQASFVVPRFCGVIEDLEISLTVTAGGQSGTATRSFAVSDAVNEAPFAEAGADFQAGEGVTVTLDGSASSDCNGDALTYVWSQLEGPAVVLSDASAATPTFTSPGVIGPTVLRFRLSVDDGRGLTGADTVSVTILDDVNEPPVASAGAPLTVPILAAVTLAGTATDPNPADTTFTWVWTQVSGPTVTLTGADTATPGFTAPASPAALTFQLVVSDGRDFSAPATVDVNVVAGGPDYTRSTIEAAPTVLRADGTSTSLITVSLRDAGGTGLAGEAVALSTTAGTLLGSLTDHGGGTYSQALQAPTSTASAATLTFTVGGVSNPLSAQVVFEPGDPAGTLVLVASPPALEADGVSTSTVSTDPAAPIVDVNGNVVADGQRVTVSTTLGVIDPAQDQDAATAGVQVLTTAGRVSFVLRSATATGTALVRASSVLGTASGQLSLGFVAGGPVQAVTVTTTDGSLRADGASATTVSAGTFRDVNGNVVAAGTLVTVEVAGGTVSGTDADPTMPGFQTAVDAAGQVSFGAVAGTVAGDMVITVTNVQGTTLGSATVTLVPGPASGTIVLTASPDPIIVSGTISARPDQSVVTSGVLVDAYGNQVRDGTLVTLVVDAPAAFVGTDADPAMNGFQVATSSGSVIATVQAGVLAGVVTVQASAGSAAGSTQLTIDPGPPSALVTVSGGGQTGRVGQALPSAFVVEVQDVHANVVPGVDVSWLALSGWSSTIAPATTTTGGAGRASATGTLGTRVNDPAGDPPSYFFEAAALDAAMQPLSGSPLSFQATAEPGAPHHLAFQTQPNGSVAGQTISPAVVVEIRDAYDNLVTSSSAQVTIALGSNPGADVLKGPTTVTAIGGVATFGGLILEKAASGYDLLTSATGLTPAVSTAFTVVHGPAHHLAFGAEPSDAVAGVAIAPAIQVQVQDAFGNMVTNATSAVTLSLGTNPGGAILSGTTTVNASGGTASFATLSLNKVGSGYDLRAAAAGLTGAVSGSFQIRHAPPAALVFGTQPTSTASGEPITPAPTVELRDTYGNLADTATNQVAIALETNPGGAILSGTLTVTASAGVAAFPGLVLDAAASGYTLVASSGVLTPASSLAFEVTAGLPNRLSFGQQPTNVVAGAAISPAVTVEVRDGANNLAADFNGAVTLSLGTNPGGATLTGTPMVTAVAGVATFTNLRLDKAAAGYTLVASSGSLSPAASSAFDVQHAGAHHLAFGTQPSSTVAGVAISPAVRVEVRDLYENVVATATHRITLSIGTNPGGGTLSGTVQLNAVAGVSVFPDLSIDRAGGGYTLSANAPGLSPVLSTPFAIVAGEATTLEIAVQPTNTAAGVAISPSFSVRLVDALGNLVTTATNPVVVTLGSNPGGGTLAGSTSLSASAGVATFPDLWIDKVGAGYTLVATSGSLTPATSAGFSVIPGEAHHLAFGVQPTDVAAGAAISPAVQVRVHDLFENLVTGSSLVIALSASGGTGTLGGTTSRAASAGLATFDNLTLDTVGSYTLSAAAPGVVSATSATFAVTPGAEHHLAFTVEPSTATAGVSISPAVRVSVMDAFGNTVTTSTTAVTVALSANPWGGTLSGLVDRNAVNGVAIFSDLSIDKAGEGYALAATAPGLLQGASQAFAVMPNAADHLAFGVQPTSVVAGVSIAPAVTVEVRDAWENLVPSAAGLLSLSLGNGGVAVLGGNTPVAPTAGVASFAGLWVDKAGAGYTLVAAYTGLVGATSTAFDVSHAEPDHLTFTTGPQSARAGESLGPVTVQVEDAFQNVVTGSAVFVTLTLTGGDPAASLSGTTTASVTGTAVFADLWVDKAAAGYALLAASAGLTGATSASFDISAADPHHLAFAFEPGTVVAGEAFVPAVQVAVLDLHENLVTGSTAAVSMAIQDNPAGGTLSGTTLVNAAGGLASFANLSVERAGTGYTLAATSAGLAGATSAAFEVTHAAADHLAFEVEPSDVVAGASIAPAVEVSVRDVHGNLVTNAGGPVVLALSANPGSDTLGGTTSQAPASGIATFADLTLQVAAAGYTLAASSAGMTGAESAPFAVLAGAKDHLSFTAVPTSVVAGEGFAVEVRILDAAGNTVSSAADAVTLAIGNGPPGAVLSGTLTQSAIAGVAGFSGLSLETAAAGYTLTASAGGLPLATSSPFEVTHAAAHHLAFAVEPQSAAAGALLGSVTVRVEDAFGNPATGTALDVTLALDGGDPAATLAGTLVRSVSGSGVFDDLWVDKASTGYRLLATGAAVTGATSAAFDITAGAADHLAFTVEPTSALAGVAIAPAVEVTVVDLFGNLVDTGSYPVSLAIQTNPGAGTLSGTSPVDTTAGIASFADLSIDKAGTGYTLAASSAGLAGAVSAAFDVSPGAADHLAFLVEPVSTTAGAAITPAVQVRIADAYENTVTSATDAITLGIFDNPGAGTLGGTLTVAASSGIATFGDLWIDKAGTGYTLQATGSPGTVGSAAFDITAGTARYLGFRVQPSSARSGEAISPVVEVQTQDQFGNFVAAAKSITLSLDAGACAGVLAGTNVQNTVDGVATFPGLSVDRICPAYTLTASTNGGWTSGISEAFEVTPGPPVSLAFTVSPGTSNERAFLAPAPQVTVYDAFTQVVTNEDVAVSVVIGTNPAAGSLSGTTTVTTALGVATFSDVRIDLAGTGYTLVASSGALPTAESAAFDVTTCTMIATAAADLTLAFPWDTVHLTSAGSDDCGRGVVPAWSIVSRPGSSGGYAPFSSPATTASGAEVDYYVVEAGTYELGLTLDDGVDSVSDSVTVVTNGFARIPYGGVGVEATRALAVRASDGHVFIGTEDRGQIYRPGDATPVVNLWCLTDTQARSVAISPSGTAFFGFVNDRRLDRLDGEGPCAKTAFDPNPIQDTNSNAIYGLVFAGSDLYAATNEDVAFWSETSQAFTADYAFTAIQANNSYADVALDGSGMLWVASNDTNSARDGIIRTPLPPVSTTPRTTYTAGDDRVDYFVPGLYAPAEGLNEMWMGTGGNGVYYVPDADTPEVYTPFTSGLPSTTVNDGAMDAQGDVWFSTTNGLARYKRDVGAFAPLTKQTLGLPNDDHRALAFDEGNGRGRILYVSTDLGVYTVSTP